MDTDNKYDEVEMNNSEEEEHHHHHDEECDCGEEHHHHHHHHDDEECDCGEEHHHHHHHHDDDECDCGEEHHHHHHHDDEECDCGEEHHHHHHDDEECDCGEEHHHHHHHDEECDCGHEHTHHHEHEDGVGIVSHDGALAGSFKIKTSLTKEAANSIIRESMSLINEIVDKHEGVVGHIKAAIVDGDHTAMYSLTYDEVNMVGEYDEIQNVEEISFASIVYGLEEVVLRSLLIVAKERLS